MDTARIEWLMTAPGTADLRTILDLFQRPAWHTRAACRGMGPAPFFAAGSEPSPTAAAICAGCPVRPECAEQGSAEADGTWGGQTAYQRRRAVRQGAA